MLTEPTRLREWILAKPLVEWKTPKRGRIPSTIVMAFRCKDGAVLASDLQVSSGSGASLSMEKPYTMSNTGIVGYTVDELAWANEFERYLEDTPKQASDLERLRLAEREYSASIMSRYPDKYPTTVDLEEILATYDKGEPMIYRFGLHKPPHQLRGHTRLVVGEPIACEAAETYLRVVEYATLKMFPAAPDEGWMNYSSSLVADFCEVILTALPSHVQSVNGASIYGIDGKGVGPYFIGDKLGSLDEKVSALAEKAMKEIGGVPIMNAAQTLNLLPYLGSMILKDPRLKHLFVASPGEKGKSSR